MAKFQITKHFYSNLTKSNITEEEYQFVQQTWQEKGWKTLKDMLIYYNIMDCIPFIEAVGKLLITYLAEEIDIFKTSFSQWGGKTPDDEQEIKWCFLLPVPKKTRRLI